MGRTIDQIQQSIIDAKNAKPELAVLDSPSQVAIWRLWTYIVAVAIYVMEGLWDIKQRELEDLALKAVPGTEAWLQAQVLKFQYSTIDPQAIQLINFAPAYQVVDPTLRIITRCSVKQQVDKAIKIKVAKGVQPDLVPLITAEQTALESYIDKIKFAGTVATVVTLEADRMQVNATVYFDPQYTEAKVKQWVKDAIVNYFNTLPFDGIVYNSKLEDAIQAVTGVLDVVMGDVKARKAQDAVGLATVVARFYETVAGHVIPEDTPTYTLDESIIMQTA